MIDGSGRGWNVEIAPDLTQQLVAVHDPLVPLSQHSSTPNSRCVRYFPLACHRAQSVEVDGDRPEPRRSTPRRLRRSTAWMRASSSSRSNGLVR